MATEVFAFEELVETSKTQVVSAALGAAAAAGFKNDADRGKCVKLGTAGNFVPCAAGDEIAGNVYSVDITTVNGGFDFGSVRRNERFWAEIASDQGVTPMAVGDLVVAGAGQAAAGTAGDGMVKTGTPTTFLWQCIRIKGTGVAGDKVLLERV